MAVGIAEAADAGRFYNTTLLITPDGVALKYRKTHLWASDRGIFTPGDRYATALWNGIRVGLLICFDIEFPETARALGQLGAELIIVTNGNMDPYGPTHRTAIMARAMENQAYAVMVNRVGEGDGGLVFAGGSAVVDPYGQLLGEAGREECRQIVELDLGRSQDARRDYRYLAERRLVLPGERREHDGRPARADHSRLSFSSGTAVGVPGRRAAPIKRIIKNDGRREHPRGLRVSAGRQLKYCHNKRQFRSKQ